MLPPKCCHLPCLARPHVHPPSPDSPTPRKSCLVGHSNEKPSAVRPRRRQSEDERPGLAAAATGQQPPSGGPPVPPQRRAHASRAVLLRLGGGPPFSRQFDEQQPLTHLKKEGGLHPGVRAPPGGLSPWGEGLPALPPISLLNTYFITSFKRGSATDLIPYKASSL